MGKVQTALHVKFHICFPKANQDRMFSFTTSLIHYFTSSFVRIIFALKMSVFLAWRVNSCDNCCNCFAHKIIIWKTENPVFSKLVLDIGKSSMWGSRGSPWPRQAVVEIGWNNNNNNNNNNNFKIWNNRKILIVWRESLIYILHKEAFRTSQEIECFQ
jgi:hypothetical protein